MRISELTNLINELVNGDNLAEKQKQSLASKIKKSYNMIVQELKIDGKNISFFKLTNLINPLLENYDKVKKYNSINEVMQQIAEEYRNVSGSSSKEKERTERAIEDVYKVILGNPGTSIDGMTSEYISRIIRLKLTENEGINRDDILNVLAMQSQNMYLDIEQYQKLINDSIIIYLTNNPNAQQFSNPKVFEIFESLAASYKVQENYDKVREVYEQALRIKSLENTPEYMELKENYERFLDYLEMKRNFIDRRFDSFQELMDSLIKTYTSDDIFAKGKQPRTPGPIETDPPDSNYIMPIEKKLEGFKRLINALKRIDDKYDILECQLGRGTYSDYVIFKIEGANVSILENFETERNEALFIVKNEMIDQIKLLTKREAKSLPGVETVNHIEEFENYCKNLIRKTLKLIRATQIGIVHEDSELLFDDVLSSLGAIQVDEELEPEVEEVVEQGIEEENTTEEGEIEPEIDETTSIEDILTSLGVTLVDEEVEPEVEEVVDQGIEEENTTEEEIEPETAKTLSTSEKRLEEERKKAMENILKVRELEEELNDIEQKTALRIAQIKKSDEHPQN